MAPIKPAWPAQAIISSILPTITALREETLPIAMAMPIGFRASSGVTNGTSPATPTWPIRCQAPNWPFFVTAPRPRSRSPFFDYEDENEDEDEKIAAGVSRLSLPTPFADF